MRPGAAAAALAILAGCAGAEPSLADKPALCSTSGVQAATLDHGGVQRSFQLVVPAAASQASPRPLVVGLHGGWGTGEGFGEQSGLTELAQREGFVLALPDGRWRSWNAGSCCGRAASQGYDDVGFVTALVETLAATDCVDASRIYATGFSNGAMLAHRMACEAPDVFNAMAPVAGPRMTDACDADTPVSALLIRGADDPRIPLAGGTFDGSFRASLDAMAQTLAQRNQCDGSRTESRAGAHCTEYSGCANARSVHACTVIDTGHQWPGGKTFLKNKLGPNPGVFDASQAIWAFFEAQPAADATRAD